MKVAQKLTKNDSKNRVADTRQSSGQNQLAQIDDNRPEAIALRELIDGIQNSPRVVAQRQQIEGYLGDSSQQTSTDKTTSIHLAQPIQAKLAIGQPDDKYEQEADRVAAQVVEQIHAPTTEQAIQGQSLQREILPEEVLRSKLTLQRHEAIEVEGASNHLEAAINHAKGGGQPLDAHLQQSMGQAMGADFSGVRVHTDSQADQLNQSIQAKAFTTGQDVFFRQGAYDPESHGGQMLIAHELTHVVQQGKARDSNDNECTRLQPRRTADYEREIIHNRIAVNTKIMESQIIQAQWWKRLPSFFYKGNFLAQYKVIDNGFRYKVDTRSPDIIFKEGLWAKVIRLPADKITMEDIEKHQRSAINNPGIVSTALTLDGAITFAYQLGKTTPGIKYIYKIDVSGQIEYPTSENIPWWQRIFYSEQQESMIAFGVEPERITFVKELYTSGEDDEGGFLD